jgi:hypothetical protein
MKKLVLLQSALSVAAVCLALSGCSGSSFKAGSSSSAKTQAKPATKPADESNTSGTASQGDSTQAGQSESDGRNAAQSQPQNSNTSTALLFTVGQSAAQIDMVWALDTSGSMTEEIDQVNKNLQAFTNSLSKSSNLSVSILGNTCSSGGSKICINSMQITNSSVKLHNIKIGSTNALEIILKESASTGVLAKWYRPAAKKVFVVVTDDHSAVASELFLQTLKKQNGIENPIGYAFAGIKKSSNCDIAREGIEYFDLAKATGGNVFDICQADWKQHFAELSNEVLKTVQSRFELTSPQTIASVVSVSVDGKAVEASNYTYVNGVLEFKGAAASALQAGQKVQVVVLRK